MSSKTHNKKRNTILVYEFLIRTMSRALMEDDRSKQGKALRIIRRHFKEGSELYKEFRLAHAMYQTTVSSSAVAASIMQEAKLAVRALDTKRLEREKSLLIREINHSIGPEVYDEHVDDYKILATIQTLFNEWQGSSDISRLAEYEDKVNSWLINEKVQSDVDLGDLDAGTTRLVSSIMTKKLNEKYEKTLNSTQKEILRIYALENNEKNVGQFLSGVLNRLLEKLSDIKDEKLSEIRDMLLAESLSTINDETITRFMMYAKLEDDLREGSNE